MINIVDDQLYFSNSTSLRKDFEEKLKTSGIDFNFLSEKDTGIYNAWNKGVKMAKGDWIAFLGSDDEYYPEAINMSNYSRRCVLTKRAKTNLVSLSFLYMIND